MSLILDALNRAEQERKNQDQIPDLTSVHTLSVNDAYRSNHKFFLLILMAVLVIVILVVVIYLGIKFFDKQKNPSAQHDASQQIPVVEPRVQAVVSSNRTSTNRDLKNQDAPIQEASAAAASIADTPIPDAISDGSIESLYETQASTDSPVATKVDDLYSAQTRTASTAIVEPFATIAGAPVDEVVDEPLNLPPPRTFESITNVPDFNQLAWNFKQQIPTISYSRHNYVERGIRSVVINGQVLGVGNVSTSSQLVIEDIFVDGVIVRYRDTSFKLKALNGWINM